MLSKIFGKTIFLPGLYTLDKNSNNYVKILNKIGIKYIVIENNFYNDNKLDITKIEDYLKNNRVKKIITDCPHLIKDLIYNGIKVKNQHIVEIIFKNVHSLISEKDLAENLQNKDMRIEDNREIITYHDPCNLGRKIGIYSIPRELIKAFGYKLIEFDEKRENSFCCGGFLNNEKIVILQLSEAI